MVQLFSIPAFFILFRETLEASIILSVMLTLIHKLVPPGVDRRRMSRQVWSGVAAGVSLALAAAAVFLSLYYTVAKKAWDSSEPLWEGILGLIAVVLITIMAFSMLRVDTWRQKWEQKLTKATVDALNGGGGGSGAAGTTLKGRYALFLIPFTVVLREGVEAVIFLGGIGLEGSATAYPIAAVVGAMAGILVGYLLYKGGTHTAFKVFLGAATLLLFVIAAGLFAGSVHEFEEYTVNEHFLWKLSCCDPEGSSAWSLLGAVVGWRNEATQGTLSAYILYWVFVAVTMVVLHYKWRREAAASASQAAAPPASAYPV